MEEGETSSTTSHDAVARPWQSYHTVYTNAKAGMDGVDKEKVQRIVYEMSKGSNYFKNEERKEAFIKQKIETMRAQCAKLTAADLRHYQMVADNKILELEATRDLSRVWLHVDMDAFYAAVETLTNPSLKGKPMAVGSMSMISTANYEARRFGVRAAMPGFIARKLCPGLTFVPVDFKKYTHYSTLIRRVFERYDVNFITPSLDEAYLDITGICKERGSTSGEIAEEMRSSVYAETGLTCSGGVAPNRLLAKVCSDINKPNGQFVLPNDRMAVTTFVSSLPVRKIAGIGKVTERILQDVFKINTCEDMLRNSGFLCALFSPSSSDFFLSVGLGLGQTDTPQVKLRKSISNERTFSATGDEALFYQKLDELANMLSKDMQEEGLHGRTLTLKLKTASFEVRTRAVTLQKYTCSRVDILQYALKLLKAELPVSLRLIGLRMSHFSEEKVGAPSDPSQKTITSFITSGDASGKNPRLNSYLGSDVGNSHAGMLGSETGLESHDSCHSDSACLIGNNQSSVHCTCTFGIDAGEAEEAHGTPSNESSDADETEKAHGSPSNKSADVGNSHANMLGTDMGFESHDTCHSDSASLIGNNQSSVHFTCPFGVDAGEAEEAHGSPSNESAEKVNASDVILNSRECDQSEFPQLEGANYSSCSGEFKGSGSSVVKRKRANPDEAVSSANKGEQFLSVDDYKCPLCGIELPPDFVEERQEHSDFHLAERLQEDETITRPRNSIIRQSFIQKDRIESRSEYKKKKKKKKKKSAPDGGKHLTIDVFFGQEQ